MIGILSLFLAFVVVVVLLDLEQRELVELEWNPFSYASRAARAERDGALGEALWYYDRAGQPARVLECLYRNLPDSVLRTALLEATAELLDLEKAIVTLQPLATVDLGNMGNHIVNFSHEMAATLWQTAERVRGCFGALGRAQLPPGARPPDDRPAPRGSRNDSAGAQRARRYGLPRKGSRKIGDGRVAIELARRHHSRAHRRYLTMKRLPRVPVWLILLPLVALALAALFVPVAARGFTNSDVTYAAPQPRGAGSAANPTPGPQQAHARPQPGPGPRDGKAMHDTAWGGLLVRPGKSRSRRGTKLCSPRPRPTKLEPRTWAWRPASLEPWLEPRTPRIVPLVLGIALIKR